MTPVDLLSEHGSDAVRYWSASARLANLLNNELREGDDPLRWPRLSEQNFRIDKWSLCRG